MVLSRGLFRLLTGLYPAFARTIAPRLEQSPQLVESIGRRIPQAVEHMFQATPPAFRERIHEAIQRDIKDLLLHYQWGLENIQQTIGDAIRVLQQYPKEYFTPPALPLQKKEAIVRYIQKLGGSPQPVYHVTTDLPSVLRQGLRLQAPGRPGLPFIRHLAEAAGKPIPPVGLGGTQVRAAAFVTHSKEAAINSAQALKNAINISKGATDPIDLIVQELPTVINNAEHSQDIRELSTIVANIASILDRHNPDLAVQARRLWLSMVDDLDKAIAGSRQEAAYIAKQYLLKLKPYLKEYATPDDKLHVYKTYLSTRYAIAKIADPLLLGHADQYKQLDPDKVGIVEIYTLPYTLYSSITKKLLEKPPSVLPQAVEHRTSPDSTQLELVRPKRAWIFESTILPLLLLLAKLQQRRENQGG